MTHPWFHVVAAAKEAAVDIHINDFIGDWLDDAFNKFAGVDVGVTSRAFIDQLAELPKSTKTIRVHINSPGGDVQAAVNIANALRDQAASKGRRVETIVDGMAASAASIVMMAGQTVTVADNAIVMIHNPWTIALGDAGEMRKTAEVLDAVRSQVIRSYQWHSPLSDAKLGALMDAETWMNADEAIAHGLATHKTEGLAAAASLDPRGVAPLHVPDRFRDRVAALVRPGQAALMRRPARDLVRPTTKEIPFDPAAAESRAREIRGLCRIGNLTALADFYVGSSLSAAEVGIHVCAVSAALDNIEVDGTLLPPAEQRAGLNIGAIYRERNGGR